MQFDGIAFVKNDECAGKELIRFYGSGRGFVLAL